MMNKSFRKENLLRELKKHSNLKIICALIIHHTSTGVIEHIVFDNHQIKDTNTFSIKADYINKTYNDNLQHSHDKRIQIIDYSFDKTITIKCNQLMSMMNLKGDNK